METRSSSGTFAMENYCSTFHRKFSNSFPDYAPPKGFSSGTLRWDFPFSPVASLLGFAMAFLMMPMSSFKATKVERVSLRAATWAASPSPRVEELATFTFDSSYLIIRRTESTIFIDSKVWGARSSSHVHQDLGK